MIRSPSLSSRSGLRRPERGPRTHVHNVPVWQGFGARSGRGPRQSKAPLSRLWDRVGVMAIA
jgi:hypothetical protein